MRFLRIALVGAAAALAAACSDDANDFTTPDVPPLAYVRYINAVPDTLNTTVRFIDQVEWSPMTFVDVPFRQQGAGNYQPTEAGARKFRVFTTNTSTVSTSENTVILVDTTLTFEAGKYYTLLHTGYARTGASPRQRIVAINDVFPEVGQQIALRTINTMYGAGAVDVYTTATTTTPIAGAPRFANVPTEGISAYVTMSPAAFAMQVAAAGSTSALTSVAAPAGTAGTTAADPIGGAAVGGSVITAITFPVTPADKPGTRFTTPGVAYFIDKHPARTVP
jgi:hypothetical protein